MSDKSYVTMEQKACVVCGKTHDTGALLLDRRLRERFDHKTVTGYEMCDEHGKLKDAGYVAMIACDESKSRNVPRKYGPSCKPSDMHRTGSVAHVKRTVWEQLMTVPVPESMVCFCGQDVIDKLESMKTG